MRSRPVVVVPHLGRHEDVVAGTSLGGQGAPDPGLVAVEPGGVDVPVPGRERGDTAASTSSSGTCQTPKPIGRDRHRAGGRGEVGRRHVGHAPTVFGDGSGRRVAGDRASTSTGTGSSARTTPRRRRTGAWATSTLPRVTDDRTEVHRAEGLREQQHPEGRADDGVDEADDGDGTGIHPGQPAEPQDVAEGRPDEAEVEQGERRADASRAGRWALDHAPRPGASSRPPATSCHDVVDEHVVGRRPALDEDEAQADDDAPRRRRRPRRARSTVPARSFCHTRVTTPATPTTAATRVTRAWRSPRTRKAIAHDDQGRQRGERRRRGRSAGGRRRGRAGAKNSPWLRPPSTTERPHHRPRGSRRTQSSRSRPAGQDAGRGGEERAVRREPELGHGVRRPPHDRRDGGEGDGGRASVTYLPWKRLYLPWKIKSRAWTTPPRSSSSGAPSAPTSTPPPCSSSAASTASPRR